VRYSVWKHVVAVVIQGSVLDPILFLLYISDTNYYLPSDAYHPKYADSIFNKIIDDHTQNSTDGMSRWSKDNLMRLNNIKTRSID
jgi:hypothetical protein